MEYVFAVNNRILQLCSVGIDFSVLEKFQGLGAYLTVQMLIMLPPMN